MDGLLLICCRSCLRGGDNTEYYSLLGIDRRADIDSIKKAYKKASLNLHPDKLAQKGITQTNEHREQFVKIKEAYEVLIDTKRRKLYDELGASGLKLLESPQEVNPAELIKNFQKNKADRCTIALLFLFLIFSLLVLPVLFSLKCDGLNIPWTALWTPMWIVDVLLLVSIIAVCFMKKKKSKDSEDSTSLQEDMIDEENDDDDTDGPSLPEKVINFIVTTSFVLAQIFLVMRLDENIQWNWFAVFAPWFAYEAVSVLSVLFYGTAFSSIPSPTQYDPSINTDDSGDEYLMRKVTEEMEYFKKLILKSSDRKQVVVSVLRAWLAIFLAVKANHSVDWNWGLVLLPIWVYLFFSYIESYNYRQWGNQKIQENMISEEEVSVDPLKQVKFQQGTELVGASQTSCIFTTLGPLLIAILLVCRLEVSTYSTFIIIIPVFIVIGCCFCMVFGVIFCLSNLDAESLEKGGEMGDLNTNGDEEAPPSNTTINDTDYLPPPPPTVEIVSTTLLPPPPTADSNDID